MIEELHLPRPCVDPDLILRLQKYRAPDRVSPAVRETARKMASLAEALVEPRGWMRREAVAAVEADGRVRLAGGIEFCSRALARTLRDAAEAVLVILTIGPALERHAQDLVETEQLAEGLLLDTAGWAALDALVKDLRTRLRAEVSPLRLTGRMAPGFADWPLEQQRILFSAFSGGRLSVELTGSCVMLPRKSISGIYGLVPASRRRDAALPDRGAARS
ncbi:MAG: hypothetical protein QN131_02580 [Armatimonadota bacterium]|nr:hypothetical protein [Armatimonadota bacterium]MDR7548810.1 hypothetical protein [Armatimonadota bacterium]